MPAPFERHARNSWEWGTRPSKNSLTQQAVNDDPLKKSPAKKDPDRCKSSESKLHTQVIRLYNESPQDEFKARCRWGSRWGGKSGLVVAWHCEHELVCSSCGRVFNRFLGKDYCPQYPGTKEQRAVVEQQIFERNEYLRTASQWNRKKPAVTGKQGYRRKKRNGESNGG